MAAINKVPEANVPLGRLEGRYVLADNAWYLFFNSVSSLFMPSPGGGAASALLDTVGSVQGGMLARFSTGWSEFVASQPNTIPVMNPGGVDVDLKSISEILDTISAVRGTVLFRGATHWQALAPGTPGHKLTTQGPGADPTWAP